MSILGVKNVKLIIKLWKNILYRIEDIFEINLNC